MVSIRRHARHWGRYFACGGSVLILAALSPTRQPSEHRAEHKDHADTQAEHTLPETTSPATGSKVIQPIASQSPSAAGADKHDDESGPKWTDIVVACASIGSFVFTAALWISTRNLWIETKRLAAGAETQSADMKESITQATRSADAMNKSSDAAHAQIDKMAAQQAILSETLIASQQSADAAKQLVAVTQHSEMVVNRAYTYLVVNSENCNDFLNSISDCIEIEWCFTNFGKTPSTNKNLAYEVKIVPFYSDQISTFRADFGRIVLAEGESCEVRRTRADHVPHDVNTARQGLLNGQFQLYFYGSLTYLDVFGQQRLTKWCFKYDTVLKSLHNFGGDRFNIRS